MPDLADTIDLSRHAVVEASAGTGKTHAIQTLVGRLVADEDVPLDQVLVMTFTEKATAELKGRLRDELHRRLAEAPKERSNLRRAIDEFDQAPIFTIHGFCQRLLQEYPLEHGHDFRAELVHDRDLLPSALREVQRRIWREEFGAGLGDLLENAGYDRAGAAAWERRVCQIAARFQPRCGHRLLPEIAADPARQVSELIVAAIHDLRALAEVPPVDPSRHPWIVGFGQTEMQSLARNKRRDQGLAPLLAWLASDKALAAPTAAFAELLETFAANFRGAFPKDGFRLLSYDADAVLLDQIRRHCPNLIEAIARLDKLHVDYEALLGADQLALRTIHCLQGEVARVKLERGLQSFDDMIAGVARALDPAVNPEAEQLRRILRDRYRYAIIDEFQDTDPLQWDILRRLFLEGGTSRLIVVGDPKQAIFGFRGADLPTYQRATKDLAGAFGAERHALQINWRSLPDLLTALNQLFDKGDWFGPASRIGYLKALPARKTEQTSLIADSTGRAALNLVDLPNCLTLKEARNENAKFMAQEIAHLLGAGLTYRHRGKEKRLGPQDICILVFKRAEADPVMLALREASIPFTFAKQTGLWSSVEAEHLRYVLEAVARPDDRPALHKALLTDFFRIRPVDLAQCDEIAAHHPIRTLLQRWQGHAEKRQWAALFTSLLEDSGVLFQGIGAGELDRRVSNFRHLTGLLQEAGYRDNLDLLDLTELLSSRRLAANEEEGDLQPVETEQAKVQIMTIHAAKGLEFPIVFLAGGFTANKAPEVAVYRDEEDRLVFEPTLRPAAKERMAVAEEAEQRRLLYVALTRAMLKLYVPQVALSLGKNQPQWQGPIVTLLAPALAKSGVAQLTMPKALAVTPQPADVDAEGAALALGNVILNAAPIMPSAPLFPRLDDDLHQRRIVIRSFSSIHRAAELKAREGPGFGEQERREDDDAPAIDDPFRGPVVGDMVHKVLERIDFAHVGAAATLQDLLTAKSDARRCLDAVLAEDLAKLRTRQPRDNLADAGREFIGKLVWNALRTPLDPLGATLASIPARDRLAEVEFVFPQASGVSHDPGAFHRGVDTPRSPMPPEVRAEEGFLTGFIDLVFRKDGLYYLLDWKTNLLDGYDAESVLNAMDASDYHRQYRLYLQALARWLRARHGAACDVEANVGGVFYLFLRGMNPQAPGAWVYFHKPTAADYLLSKVLG